MADEEHDHDDEHEHGHEHEHDEHDEHDEQDMMASLEEMMESIRQAKVGQLLLSTVSTLASVAYGKLEAKELGEARLAIDAVGALLPLLNDEVDPGIRRDFEQALANLRLAYADAVSA